MLRILIADDEAFFRTSFISYIDWGSLGCEVVGTAADGRQTIRAVQQLHPDLVFLDIQMPGMDGLEALEWLHANCPQVHVIMLTGFNDFESVRRAMRAGAVDYIHKVELGEESLAAIVSEQQNQLRAIRQSRQDAQPPSPDRKLQLAAWMYRGGGFPFGSDQELAEYLGCREQELYVMQFTLKNFSAIADRYAGRENILYSGIENMLRQMLPRESCPTLLFFDRRKFCLIGSLAAYASRRESERQLDYLRKKVSNGLRRFCNVEAVASVSRRHQSVRELPKAAEEAQQAAMLAFSAPSERLFFAAELDRKRVVEYLDAEAARQQIAAGLRGGDISHCGRVLDELFEAGPEAVYAPNAVMMAAQGILYALCPEQSYGFWQKQIAKVEHVDKIKALLLEFLSQQTPAGSQYSALVAEAIRYIEVNYGQHELSLARIAEAVNANASYLSRLFRKEVGSTVTDQINAVRVREAKRLLQENRLTVYRVAQQVGYSNTEYFNRIFKKLAGCSPTAYRGRREAPAGEGL